MVVVNDVTIHKDWTLQLRQQLCKRFLMFSLHKSGKRRLHQPPHIEWDADVLSAPRCMESEALVSPIPHEVVPPWPVDVDVDYPVKRI